MYNYQQTSEALAKDKKVVIPACFKRESGVLLQKTISPIKAFGDDNYLISFNFASKHEFTFKSTQVQGRTVDLRRGVLCSIRAILKYRIKFTLKNAQVQGRSNNLS